MYALRTDAPDRFGTRSERRFTKDEVVTMLADAGLADIVVSTDAPYWCAVGYKRSPARRLTSASS